ncbi:cation diffusion facilitator family transporter [Candidatus Peregrinibacteria bacterium]|nr:cation diffusion facilitator family transporter [Candidatus Peregrinibacteria bacterium]
MSKISLKEGQRITGKSIIYLLLLGSAKTVAGVVTGMTVILADAISTFADTLGLFASYFGLRLSRKSADKNFEYGYYKIETLAAFLVSIGIIYLGYKIFRDSIESLFVVEEGAFRSFAITTTTISIIFSYKLYKRLFSAGKKLNSLSLIANAKDKKMDVISGVAVLGSIIANYKNIPYFEGVISITISLLILKEGILSAKESVFFLLDYWNDPILNKKIKKVLLRNKDLVHKIKKLRLRRAGTYIFGEAYIEINPFAAMQDLRDELRILQEKVKEVNPFIKDFSIFTHITKAQKLKIGIPLKSGKNLKGIVASNLKETKGYLFVTIHKGKIKDKYYKKLEKKNKKTIELARYLKNEKVNILIDNKLKSLLYYNLRRTNHILIYPNFADLKTAEKTVDLLLIDT